MRAAIKAFIYSFFITQLSFLLIGVTISPFLFQMLLTPALLALNLGVTLSVYGVILSLMYFDMREEEFREEFEEVKPDFDH